MRAPPPGEAKHPVSDPQPPASAVVAAGDEETRVLLRSLLRLHHVRVDGEARGVAGALALVRKIRPSLLVVDAVLDDGEWPELLAGARAADPNSRFVLVSPRAPDLNGTPEGLRPDALLVRPFRIRAFADALGAGPDGPARPG